MPELQRSKKKNQSADDLDINAHPVNGGVPVLDGDLHHTERPNVNAMREAIETQSEMEVGMPIDEKQEEVKAEEKAEDKAVTVERGNGGTQIIINIAGKKKTLSFSNPAFASAFIKGASAKFGSKFKLVTASAIIMKPGDRISWKLNQFSNETRQGVVTEVLPQNDEGLVIFDAQHEDLGGTTKGSVWGYMGLVYNINGQHVNPINPEAAEFEIVQAKTGEWTGKHQFEGLTDSTTHHPEIVKGNWIDLPQEHYSSSRGFSNYPGIYILLPGSNTAYGNKEGGFQSVRQAETYNREFLGGKGKVHVQIDGKQATLAPQQDADNDRPVTSGMSDIGGGAPSFKGASSSEDNPADYGCKIFKDKSIMPGEGEFYIDDGLSIQDGFYTWQEAMDYIKANKVTDASWDNRNASKKASEVGETQMKKYKVYTGPTLVQSTAERLRNAGINVTVEGTEHVHFTSDKPREEVLRILREPYQADTGAVGWSDRDIKEGSAKEAGGMNFSPSNVPSQVVQEFYPELQHELISYPNVTNAPMQTPEISGDQHQLGVAPAEGIGEATLVMNNEENALPDAIEEAFNGMNRIGYVSTSPAGGAGIGRDGKPQVLEGVPLRKENDIRGPMFMEEFNAQYEGIPGNALSVVSAKVAAAEEKTQFSLFLKRVMGEVAASFIAAFKVTSKMPMNKVPGIGEIQLAQVEQATNTSAFNIVNTGSRVKYLMEKLTDSEIQDAINDAYAQGAIWHEGKEGGFVYEVFVRAETIDTESMLLKYKFVTGTKESE